MTAAVCVSSVCQQCVSAVCVWVAGRQADSDGSSVCQQCVSSVCVGCRQAGSVCQ